MKTKMGCNYKDRDSYLSYTKHCQVMGLSVHASVANWICH